MKYALSYMSADFDADSYYNETIGAFNSKTIF
jgi:hypothetical protein